nr:BLTX731 [Nephila pilipes]
MSHCCFI